MRRPNVVGEEDQVGVGPDSRCKDLKRIINTSGRLSRIMFPYNSLVPTAKAVVDWGWLARIDGIATYSELSKAASWPCSKARQRAFHGGPVNKKNLPLPLFFVLLIRN